MSPIWQRIRGFPWRLILALYGAFGFLLFFYKTLDGVAREREVDWLTSFIEEMTGAMSGLPLLVLVAWLALRYPVIDGGWKRRWPLYAVAGVLYGFLDTTLMYVLRLASFAAIGRGVYDYGIMTVRYLMELPIQLILFSVLVTTISYGEHRRVAREREARLQALERQLAQAQLETLQLQLRPHFLFNALNAISAIVYEDPRAADRMIGRLSEFLRRVLRADRLHEVPLGEELELLELYLDVMRARFEDRLHCSVTADAALGTALVPQLVLQPIVENAIRYGVDPESGEIRIRVEARRAADLLHLEVHDCGAAAPAGNGNGMGVGLKNLAARLEKLYGAAGRLSIDQDPGQGTRVRISLPYHSEAIAG